jgi:hypothetical protein
MTTTDTPRVSDERLAEIVAYAIEGIEQNDARYGTDSNQKWIPDLQRENLSCLQELQRLRASSLGLDEREALLAGADACGFMANGSPMADKWRTWDASLRKLAERK